MKAAEVWRTAVETGPKFQKMDFEDVNHSHKMVLLLNIIARAQAEGEKVCVFSHCIKTLDFVEVLLGLPDWGGALDCDVGAAALAKCTGWQKDREFLRIDGQTSAADRTSSISQFTDLGKHNEGRGGGGGERDERGRTGRAFVEKQVRGGRRREERGENGEWTREGGRERSHCDGGPRKVQGEGGTFGRDRGTTRSFAPLPVLSFAVSSSPPPRPLSLSEHGSILD